MLLFSEPRIVKIACKYIHIMVDLCLSNNLEIKYDQDILQLVQDNNYRFLMAEYLPKVRL